MSDDDKDGNTDTSKEVEKWRTRAQKFEGKLADLEKQFEKVKNIDPEKYHALIEEVENLRNDSAGGDPKKIEALVKKAKDEVRAELSKDINSRDEEIKNLRGQVKGLSVDSRVFTQISGDFVKSSHDDLQRYIREACDIDDSGEIYVRDEKGEPRYSTKNRTQKMTVTEWVEELKEKKPHMVIDNSVAGSKASGQKMNGSGGAKITTLSQLAGLTPDQQREALSKIDVADAKNMIKGVTL